MKSWHSLGRKRGQEGNGRNRGKMGLSLRESGEVEVRGIYLRFNFVALPGLREDKRSFQDHLQAAWKYQLS